MRFIKDIGGGIVIILAAGLIGLAANSMREKPIPLIARVPKAVARTKPAPPAPEKKAAVDPAETTTEAVPEVSKVPVITDEEAEAGELTKERLKWLIEAETIVLIDARGVGEYIGGHLPGAINIPYDNFVEYYDKLDQIVPLDADVAVYCRSVDCDLSDHLAQELRLMGYERVVLYRGGVMEWEEAGYPLETLE